MRTPRSALPALLALTLLAPAALAAPAQGGFVTPQPVALWGGLRMEVGEAPVALDHAGPADSLLLAADSLVVRVETVERSPGKEDVRSVEEHTFRAAEARPDEGAAVAAQLAPGTVLTLARPGPAPLAREDAARQPPSAMVQLGGAMQGSEVSCDAKPCPGSRGAVPAVTLQPLAPFEFTGATSLVLQPGGAIEVRSTQGTERFASERREETRASGGIAVPLLGPVAQQEERVETITIVTLLSERARVQVTPASPGLDGGAGRDSAAMREPPAGATRLRAEQVVLDLDGSVGLREAHGTLEVDGQRHDAQGQEVLVAGALRLTLGAAKDRAPREGLLGLGALQPDREAMLVQLEGDATHVDIAGGATEGPAVYQAAAAVGALGAVGLLALFAPVAKYGFSKVMAVPLYARLEKQHLLDNGLRAQLHELIRREPGASPAELARQMPCSWNTLVYHLSVLEREGYVSRAREGRRWRFFPAGAQDHSALPALAALKNPRAARLVREVHAAPGIPQHQLSARLAVQPSTVHWHMERLVQAGLVRAERDGRVVRYYPGPAAPQPPAA